jgi:predicted  nucleic acid-binding Zn-ribbon protein
MPVPIAELFISVGADVAGATAGLNTLSNNIQNFGNRIQRSGRALTTGLTAPIVGVGAAVFSVGSDFEHAFTQVRRTVDGLDPTQLEELRQSLIGMSKTSSGGLKTASELAEIAAVGGQLGLAGSEIKSFTSLVARLSLATDLPFGEIAEDVGRSIKIMGLAENQYEAFGAVVAALGNQMGGTERDIFEFSRRLAATLSAVGVKPEQILAISAALSEAGVNPEAGATAINKFFVEMVNSLNDTSGASEETKQKLQSLKDTLSDLSDNLQVAELRQKEFGRNTPASVVKASQLAIDKYKREIGQTSTKLDEFASSAAGGKLSIAGMAKVAGIGEDEFRALVKNDPAKAFASFVAGLQEISKTGGAEALTKTLADLGITEERQRETLLALAASEKSLPKALDVAIQAWAEQKALQDEVNAAMKDTQNQLKLMVNSIQADLIPAFDKQKESIQQLIDSINNDLLPAFKRVTDLIPTLTPDQLKGFAALAALGPALIGVGIVISAIGALASPLGVVILALAGLGIAFDQIANNWENTKAIMDKIPMLSGVAFAIDFVKKHGDEIKAVLGGIVTEAGKFGEDFNRKLTSAVLGVGAIFEAFGTFLSSFFDTVILPILDRFKGWIQEKIVGAFISILEFLQTLGVTSLPGGADIGSTISGLKAAQATAAGGGGGGAGGFGDVNVTINNPQVTSQALLDKLATQVSNAITTAIITAEKSVVIAPQPLPGQVPVTPF